MTDQPENAHDTESNHRAIDTLADLAPELKVLLKRLASERRSSQAWATVKRGAVALAFVLMLSIWLFGYGTALGVRPAVIAPTVAQVDIRGKIGDGHLSSADRLVPLIADVCHQPLVKALVLHIDSPGGAPGDAERIGDAIDACKVLPTGDEGRSAGRRPVVAVIDGMGASAAYMIAVHADHIVANPTGIVGSIGIIIEGLKFDRLMDRVGVTGYAYASGNLKTMLSPYAADTPAQQRVAQELADQAMVAFRSVVVKRRPNLKADYPDLWSGRVWVAGEAMRIGLIDEVGLLEPTERTRFPGLTVQRFAPQHDVRDALSIASISNAVVRALADRALSVH